MKTLTQKNYSELDRTISNVTFCHNLDDTDKALQRNIFLKTAPSILFLLHYGHKYKFQIIVDIMLSLYFPIEIYLTYHCSFINLSNRISASLENPVKQSSNRFNSDMT